MSLSRDERDDDGPWIDPRLDLGAEPYWMQDVRLAMRRIEARRRAARTGSEDQASPSEEDPLRPS